MRHKNQAPCPVIGAPAYDKRRRSRRKHVKVTLRMAQAELNHVTAASSHADSGLGELSPHRRFTQRRDIFSEKVHIQSGYKLFRKITCGKHFHNICKIPRIYIHMGIAPCRDRNLILFAQFQHGEHIFSRPLSAALGPQR